MVTSPPPAPTQTPQQTPSPHPILNRIRFTFLSFLCVLFFVCLVFAWLTRDAMGNLSFLQSGSRSATLRSTKTIVDLTPWQTAQALAPLAVSTEEIQFAQEAERLADHEVDQAFASALRLATTQVHTLTGEALELSQKVQQLQQIVQQDQATVDQITQALAHPPSSKSAPLPTSDDLEVAKAQLGLDNDQLSDAQQDLARASGDQRPRIQQELTAHEDEMKKYDAQVQAGGEVAVVSVARYRTLAHRISAWFAQRTRYQLLQQALDEARSSAAALTTQHNALEAQANAAPTPDQTSSTAARLDTIKQKSAQRQLLSIYDDRIQTQQQLATVYTRWSAQVLLQHRIVLHLILQSLSAVVFTLIIVVLLDLLVRKLLNRPKLDRRRVQTLRTIFQLGIQILGLVTVLFIVFGAPDHMPTILGFATAGITVVMQDFILAFFGWFVLMGSSGIRVGDTVEINGVSGEVTEIGLFRTAVLETGNWTDKGHPTGRRVTFINNFAITGQYFNFSTSGQWMWDEITISIPSSKDTYPMIEQIHKAVLDATEKDAKLAEQEWQKSSKHGLGQYSAAPAVNLRPGSSGIDILVRYVTRASERVDTRNRLYQLVLDVMQKSKEANQAAPANNNPAANPATNPA